MTGQQKVWALLRPGAAPEFCFAPVAKEDELGSSGWLRPPGATGYKVCAGVNQAQDQVSLVSRGCGCLACTAG